MKINIKRGTKQKGKGQIGAHNYNKEEIEALLNIFEHVERISNKM